ncbi:MAG: sulfatase-like hydrolase/transferase [Anaerolineae bacterium]|nr:sulfatase-like hydrolase/transferase [Anaerolineae bacterium]
MAEQATRPNVLLILTDQHRYDTLGCYGAEICQTPNIDRLAARGVRFDRAYTSTVPCSPSRAALFTGVYPHKNDVRINNQVLNPNIPNLASELGAAGYQLGYAGKWHIDDPKVATDYGFKGKDFPGYGYPIYRGLVEGLRFGPPAGSSGASTHYKDYLESHGYEIPQVLEAHYGDNPGKQGQEMYALQSGTLESSFETMVAQDTIDLLWSMKARRDEGGEPFFIWANFWGPHTPCLIPEPYYSMYDPATIPVEPSFDETWERKPFVQYLVERYWGLTEGGWARWREIVARYWGYVTMIDDLVGMIMEELAAQGLADNTVVIFSTDHGDTMGAHRLIEKGPFTYEQCYRLPMVVAHPDCEAPGSVNDEFVYLQDLYPTFLEMAGRPLPSEPDTQSILDQLLGRPTPTGRDSIYAQFFAQLFTFEQRMIRTRTHKFVYNHSDIGELYDLVNDPWEMHNLIDLPETADLQQALIERMRAHMVRLDDPILRHFDGIRHVY